MINSLFSRFIYFPLIFLNFQLLAQEKSFCITDEMQHAILRSNPGLRIGFDRANEQLKKDLEHFRKQAKNQQKSDALYIIPVVFHVIHTYGPENISDAQILDGLAQLNLQLRKQNADTNQIVNVFKSRAADTQIEFRLAQKDPNGNCTSGITRTFSPLTHIADHSVKDLIHWPPNKYLNVYVCAQAAGLAGHALLPGAADTIPQWDGIVMQHSYVGTFGTSEFFRRTVLTHEVGHYLNLQHIWGGNNVPNYYYLPVAQSANCNHDDEVEDTPLTIGWQTCNLSGNSCGSLDNVQNYMDYAYCALMFTEGQKERMHACLNSSVAGRNNLWTNENLIATGVIENNALCFANFMTSKKIVCEGQSVTLTDLSRHKVSTRTWEGQGVTFSSTTDSVVVASFAQAGTYTIRINVTHNGTTLQSDFQTIEVLPSEATSNYFSESFEPENGDNAWTIPMFEGPNNWTFNSLSAFNSNRSANVQNFEAGIWKSYELISPPINAQNLNSLALSFDFAYAQKQTTNMETLRIFYSTDCGETWTLRRTYNGSSSLRTVDTLITTAFIPVTNQWKNEVLANWGNAPLKEHLLIKFSFDAKGGNNFYLDNINLGDASVLGLPNFSAEDISIFPNPVVDHLNIQSTAPTQLYLSVHDINGKSIKTNVSSFEKEASVSTENWSSGVYFITLSSSDFSVRYKVVKQ